MFICVSERYFPSRDNIIMFSWLWNPSKIISNIVLVFEGIEPIESTGPLKFFLTFRNTQNRIIFLCSYLITNILLRLQLPCLMIIMRHRFIHRVIFPQYKVSLFAFH